MLIVELRRVDRLQALLRGPAPAMTMTLVVERLRKALRSEDRLASISDDQVCVILPRISHQSQAVLAAVKLLRALDRPIAYEGGTAVLRPCIGIATLPEHGFDPAQLLMAADVSRHIAATREEGYHVLQGEDSVETEVYRGLDLDLERAIRQAGEVEAATLVGIAERTGLIATLTFWVLKAALRQAAAWRSSGIDPQMSVNLSTAMLTDRELPALIDQGIKTWGIPADNLTLEIAESPMIADAERSMAILTRLSGVGLRISIDDFGSGYSSLGQLARLPIDELKIDRPFVAGMLDDPANRAVVRSAIGLGHHFGWRVVAEGVERPEIREALAGLGCDVAQGFLVSSPLPASVFQGWWAKNTARCSSPRSPCSRSCMGRRGSRRCSSSSSRSPTSCSPSLSAPSPTRCRRAA